MKDNSNRDEPNRRQRPDEQAAEAPRDGPEASYTPEQRRLVRKGLRIWAKVAVRSYMRKHAAGSDGSHPGPDEGGEEES